MKAQVLSKSEMIGEMYLKYSERIFNYINSRIDNREDAENLSQDVWCRVLENDTEICIETASSYLYKIATNLINDYLRKFYVRTSSREDIARTYDERVTVTPAQEYEAMELAALESEKVERLPGQRRIIYIMSRYEEMAVADIAATLSLSFRTVENHLRMGRRDVRNFITAIA